MTKYRVIFVHWHPPKKFKYVIPRLGEKNHPVWILLVVSLTTYKYELYNFFLITDYEYKY